MTPGGRSREAKEGRRWARGEAGKEGGGGNPDAALGRRRGGSSDVRSRRATTFHPSISVPRVKK